MLETINVIVKKLKEGQEKKKATNDNKAKELSREAGWLSSMSSLTSAQGR